MVSLFTERPSPHEPADDECHSGLSLLGALQPSVAQEPAAVMARAVPPVDGRIWNREAHEGPAPAAAAGTGSRRRGSVSPPESRSPGRAVPGNLGEQA